MERKKAKRLLLRIHMHTCFYNNNNNNSIADDAKTHASKKKRKKESLLLSFGFFSSSVFFCFIQRQEKINFFCSTPSTCRAHTFNRKEKKKKKNSVSWPCRKKKKREIENAGNLFYAPMDGMWFCMALFSHLLKNVYIQVSLSNTL